MPQTLADEQEEGGREVTQRLQRERVAAEAAQADDSGDDDDEGAPMPAGAMVVSASQHLRPGWIRAPSWRSRRSSRTTSSPQRTPRSSRCRQLTACDASNTPVRRRPRQAGNSSVFRGSTSPRRRSARRRSGLALTRVAGGGEQHGRARQAQEGPPRQGTPEQAQEARARVALRPLCWSA